MHYLTISVQLISTARYWQASSLCKLFQQFLTIGMALYYPQGLIILSNLTRPFFFEKKPHTKILTAS